MRLSLAFFLFLFYGIAAAEFQDWPMWRSDPGRSAFTTEQLADSLYLQWKVQYSPRTPVWDDPLNQNLMQFDKQFEFRPDDYKIIFDMVITNTSESTIQGNPFLEWTTKLPNESGGGMFSSSGQSAPRFACLIKDEVKKVDLVDIEQEEIIPGEDVAWTAIEEKYFISAIIPGEDRPAEIRRSPGDGIVSYKLIYPYMQLSPGESRTFTYALYIGPRDIDILHQQNAQLERTIDFGWFDIISKPLLLTLKFLNSFLHNYGHYH